MTDIDPALLEKAAKVLRADYESEYDADHIDWSEFADIARAVLEAVADDLRAEGAEKALLNLPVSLVEFVRSSERTQWFLARRAQITEKHLSRMLNHGEGRIDTWVRVLHAVRADQVTKEDTDA